MNLTLNFLDQPTAITDAAGTRNFTYNPSHRLASETNPAIVNGVLSYTYDTAGRFTAMSFGNGSTTFVAATHTYDPMAWRKAHNVALLASYLWQPVGLDVPLMRIADNAEEYYIVDGNKNVIALKDSSGADIATYTYTPFGAVENPTDGDENPFRFSSEYHDDETSFVYYNYRYYSPKLGRWIKRDPIEEEGGVNLYGMIENNMINNIDENGLKVEEVHIGNTYYFHVYSNVRFYDFWSSSEYLGTVTFEYKPNSVVQDNEAGLAIAQQLAKQIDNGNSLAVLAKTISDGAGCLELTLRVAVVGLDQVISVVEFAQDPSIATAIGAITVIPGGGALAKKIIPLSEFRRLMKKWDKATYGSLADSIRDHASRHGF